jgi:hypothetical protein
MNECFALATELPIGRRLRHGGDSSSNVAAERLYYGLSATVDYGDKRRPK